MPIGSHYMRFLMFLLGAAFASLSADTLRKAVAPVPDWFASLLFVAGNLVFVCTHDWYTFIPVFLMTSSVFVAKTVYGDGILHRVFCWKPLRRLGDISYSFYLFHGLAIVVFCDRVGLLIGGLPELPRFCVLLVGAFALSIAVGLVSYRLLEKPYFDRNDGAKVFAAAASPAKSLTVRPREEIRAGT